MIFSQFDYNINYDMRLAVDSDTTRDVFENYFDINMYYDDFYFYSLIKYANHPLIGTSTKDINDVLNVFYFEYSNDYIDLTVGDIFQMYGKGLSYHSYYDRNIDYNNSIRGIDLTCRINDDFDIFVLTGYNNFQTRLSPKSVNPDIHLDHTLGMGGFNYFHDIFDIHYSFAANQQKIDSETISTMKSFANFYGQYIRERFEFADPIDFEMKTSEHNLGMTFYLGDLELYFEKTLVYYNKILDERVRGSRFYFSSYFTILDYGFLYEYKKYDTPYLYSTFANPPTLFKEASSPLISRHLHSVDFSNEIGHQFSINRTFSNQVSMLFNFSFSHKNLYNDSSEYFRLSNVIDNFLKFEDLEDYSNLLPYRQAYLEFNGWSKDEKTFYKVGIDHYLEYFNLDGNLIDTTIFSSADKLLEAKTIPTQFTYKFDEGNSISMYLEFQKLEESLSANPSTSDILYFSPSYNHYGQWIISLFSDLEKKSTTNDLEGYHGLDFTYYLSDTRIISVFLGSQKGGLVCANGTCVQQPDFTDGVKVTARIMF